MSQARVDTIVNSSNNGSPSFPFGLPDEINVRNSEAGGTTTLLLTDAPKQSFLLTADRNCDMPSAGVTKGRVFRIGERGAAFTLQIRASNGDNLIKASGNTAELVALIDDPVADTDWLPVYSDSYGADDTFDTYTAEGSGTSVPNNSGTPVLQTTVPPGIYDFHVLGLIRGTQGPGVSTVIMCLSTTSGDTGFPGGDGIKDVLVQGAQFRTYSFMFRRKVTATTTFFVNMYQDTGNTWTGWGRIMPRAVTKAVS